MKKPSQNAGANHRPYTTIPWHHGLHRMTDAAGELFAEVTVLKFASKEPLTDLLAQFLSAQYILAAKAAVGKARGKPLDLKTLQALCGDVAVLRRGDQHAEWLRIERERLEMATMYAREKWKTKLSMAMEAFMAYVKDNPEAKAAFHTFTDQLHDLGAPFDKSLVTEEHKEPAPTPRTEEGTAIRPDPSESD